LIAPIFFPNRVAISFSEKYLYRGVNALIRQRPFLVFPSPLSFDLLVSKSLAGPHSRSQRFSPYLLRFGAAVVLSLLSFFIEFPFIFASRSGGI